MLSKYTIGAIASKKSKDFFEVNFSISSDNFFDVNGPVAITMMSSLKIFKFVISLLITLISLLDLIFLSMYF